MPLHPYAQQLIKQVEDLSGRPVHVTEDPGLKVMATMLKIAFGNPATSCRACCPIRASRAHR